MLKNVSIQELLPGMFVSQVIEQTGNSRMRTSGIVKTASAIEKLREMGITLVEVDLSRSQIARPDVSKRITTDKKVQSSSNRAALTSATTLYDEAISLQRTFLSTLQEGIANDISAASELSANIIGAVFENKDAMACLTMIKNSDQYLLEHSINCTILMAMFTEHLGYDRDTISEACFGALLMDVGMSKVPDKIRQKSGKLSEAEWAIVRQHVDKSLALVGNNEEVSELALSIISQHHERENASGYPRALSGSEISPLSKIVAIVDCYDAMISNRPHKESITPSLALKRLAKDETLDLCLVKQFVQCLGVHPVGSLVKLKSGRLGIIAKQHPEDLLAPVVMTFYSISGGHFSEIKRIDLSQVDDEIESGVRPDDFGINLPKFFKDVFINQVPD